MAILNTLPVAFTIALEPADISRNQQGMAQTRQPTAPSKDPCPQNLLLPYDNILTTPTYTSCYRAWYQHIEPPHTSEGGLIGSGSFV